MNPGTDRLKTIGLIIPDGFAVRSYLLSDYLPTLTENARVVIFTPQAHEEGFRSRFESDRVSLEFLAVPPLNRFQQEVRRLFDFAHYYRHESEFWQIWFSSQHLNPRMQAKTLKTLLLRHFVRPASRFLARTVFKKFSIDAQSATERLIYRGLSKEKQRLKEVLARHQVDVLVSTLTLGAYWERPVLWAASDLGIPKIFAATAWDNFHTMGQLPIRFDRFVVWSPWMADVLVGYYPDISKEEVFVAGHGYFDFYREDEMIGDRASFISALGGDPSRPVVMWACCTFSQTADQPQMIEALAEAVRRGEVRGNPQILVRPHPAGGRNDFEPLLERFPELLFMETNKADTVFGASWEPGYEDVRLAIASVAHSDVTINFSSTITLEAFIVDRPVVNVFYDHVPGSYAETFTRRNYTCGSYRPVLDLAATRVAPDAGELVTHLNAYLEDPDLDRDARRETLELICGPMDGGAARRSSDAVLDLLGLHEPSSALKGA